MIAKPAAWKATKTPAMVGPMIVATCQTMMLSERALGRWRRGTRLGIRAERAGLSKTIVAAARELMPYMIGAEIIPESVVMASTAEEAAMMLWVTIRRRRLSSASA